MEDDKSIEARALELEYQFHIQKVNASLVMLTAGIISFMSKFLKKTPSFRRELEF
ncbi:MAG: hypothetical protein AABX65_00400 [Nanoarchaeota archaeon]